MSDSVRMRGTCPFCARKVPRSLHTLGFPGVPYIRERPRARTLAHNGLTTNLTSSGSRATALFLSRLGLQGTRVDTTRRVGSCRSKTSKKKPGKRGPPKGTPPPTLPVRTFNPEASNNKSLMDSVHHGPRLCTSCGLLSRAPPGEASMIPPMFSQSYPPQSISTFASIPTWPTKNKAQLLRHTAKLMPTETSTHTRPPVMYWQQWSPAPSKDPKHTSSPH